MDISNRYIASDKLKDLISDNCRLLMVLNRFGISLGFGEKTVKEGCESHGVDVATFLAVANFIGKGDREIEGISLASLISYLLTSSLRHPKVFVEEFGDALMPCHQHGFGVNIPV